MLSSQIYKDQQLTVVYMYRDTFKTQTFKYIYICIAFYTYVYIYMHICIYTYMNIRVYIQS